jgi:hypothetical protein
MFLCVLIVDLGNVLENTLEPIAKFWEFDENILGNTKIFSQKNLLINLGIIFNLNLELKVLIKVELSNMKLFIKKIGLTLKTNGI